MKLFDSHCHLDFAVFDGDRKEIIDECKSQGIQHILLPGVTAATWSRLLKLAQSDDLFVSALGLHPYFVQQHSMDHLPLLEQYLAENKVSAIGEIGLDYYLANLDQDLQKEYFTKQLALAKNENLPVILHVRKAHDDVLQQLRKFKLSGGIVHAFSGSEQQAAQYIDLGFKLGFGGSVTYERATKLRRLIKNVPLESIVLETDAPDMAPAKYSQQRNSPVYILETLHVISELREEPVQQILRTTTQSALNVLHLN